MAPTKTPINIISVDLWNTFLNVKCVQNWANYLITITLAAGRFNSPRPLIHISFHLINNNNKRTRRTAANWLLFSSIATTHCAQTKTTCFKAFFVGIMLIIDTRRIYIQSIHSADPVLVSSFVILFVFSCLSFSSFALTLSREAECVRCACIALAAACHVF